MRTNFLTDENATQWDSYVHAHPDGTVFHLSNWQGVLNQIGIKTYFLYLRDPQDEICGVLPLAHLKHFLWGNHLVALPYCVYGGPLADSDEHTHSLLTAAKELGDELRVSDIEYRLRQSISKELPGKDLYVTFRRELAQDDDAIMKSIPRKQRAMVRKGINAELSSRITRQLDEFYPIYAESVRNLGTPVFSRGYFEALMEHFGDAADILLVDAPDGEVVAGVLNLYYQGEVLPYYGGSTFAARALKANDFMYWELMRHAVGRGATLFDFGRSKTGTGPYSFKKNWGFEPQPLPYAYELITATEVPQLNPQNPKYAAFISMWKSLPLPVANLLGPMISRNLG